MVCLRGGGRGVTHSKTSSTFATLVLRGKPTFTAFAVTVGDLMSITISVTSKLQNSIPDHKPIKITGGFKHHIFLNFH